MLEFSVAITRYGWTAKNLRTGKVLTGELNKLPDDVYRELCSRLTLNPKCLGCATKLYFSYDSRFYKWFSVMHQWAL